MSRTLLLPGPALALLLLSSFLPPGGARPGPPSPPRRADVLLAGRVLAVDGSPAAGALVTARPIAGGPTVTVFTDDAGRFELPAPATGDHVVEARAGGLRSGADTVQVGGDATVPDLRLAVDPEAAAAVVSSAWLSLLTDGADKRRFILDCTGCHQLGPRVALKDGRPRTRHEWVEAIERMLAFAGPESSFPIIGHGRDPAATADWLVGELDASPAPRSVPVSPAARRAVITEYDVPDGELPHDLALDAEGRVVATGMFRHVMYRLDPETGGLEELPIPVANAGPRALEIAPDGAWWVLLGNATSIGRRDPATGEWKTWQIGMYPHSVGRAADGRIWFNGHFTKEPALLGSLDPETERVETYAMPGDPEWGEGSPIPYELRVGPDGAVWVTELAGNRVLRFSPLDGTFRTWRMPAAHSGPRRLDVAPDGTAWIPEYAAGKLARLDPETGTIVEYDLPTPDALPYVARVDRRRGFVWVAEAGADAVARFDPGSETWVEIPLPTRGALVRHLDVDHDTGAVWAAYGHAPPLDPKLARIELREPSTR